MSQEATRRPSDQAGDEPAMEIRRDGESGGGEITVMLGQWSAGDEKAIDGLLPKIYGELHRLAAAHLRQERVGHTLDPTALVHEAYLRLMGSELRGATLENRTHFFAVATRAMRRILVEHARRYMAARRVSPKDRVRLDDEISLACKDLPVTEILALDQALERLRKTAPRKADVVCLRYFGGFSETEVAQALNISRSTVVREWRIARRLLWRSLSSKSPVPSE